MRGLEVSQEAEGTMTAFESARGNLNKKRSDEQSAFKGSQKEEAMRRLNAKGVVSTKQVRGRRSHAGTLICCACVGRPQSARFLALRESRDRVLHDTSRGGFARGCGRQAFGVKSTANSQHNDALKAFEGTGVDLQVGGMKKSDLMHAKRERAWRVRGGAAIVCRHAGAMDRPRPRRDCFV